MKEAKRTRSIVYYFFDICRTISRTTTKNVQNEKAHKINGLEKQEIIGELTESDKNHSKKTHECNNG